MRIVNIDKDRVLNTPDSSRGGSASGSQGIALSQSAGNVSHPKDISAAVNRIKQCLNRI